MLTKTKAYIANDGTVFTDRTQALKYGHALRVFEVAEAICQEAAGNTDNSASVQSYLLANAEEIIKLLTRATAKPKPPKATEATDAATVPGEQAVEFEPDTASAA